MPCAWKRDSKSISEHRESVSFFETLQMRYWIIGLIVLAGCSGPRVDLNVGKLRSNQKQHVKAANQNVKDQTGTDLGTVKPQKRKFGMPTTPVE